ncbi:MAG: TetR/AcrR family transcriptional regulator [Oscillospiraceae bacterium]|nr:TetR/AcrR family transcriptional regulator [Oscillospiraceae bacterium]
MNPKFYSLPTEKQSAILNAGFHVFSQNTYKKSPMSEIADAAGISKALLFHYFRNKKELYLFLWDTCCRITVEEMTRSGAYEQRDLFTCMDSGMQAKLRLMRQYPDLGAFAVRAFYEKDPEVSAEIRESMGQYLDAHAAKKLQKLDPEDFIPGIDLQMMYREMYWASEGCLWEYIQRGCMDVNAMEEDFRRLLAHWKKTYLRKEREEASL